MVLEDGSLGPTMKNTNEKMRQSWEDSYQGGCNRVFAENQIMTGFCLTGYSGYQNGIGFEPACENSPNNEISVEVETKF